MHDRKSRKLIRRGQPVPAKGTITGVYEIDRETLDRIRREADEAGRMTCHFETDLLDEAGVAVAHVTKEIYVRKKSASR